MRKYYTDSYSNSLSDSETDDSELEKNETMKDRVSVSAHNKLEFSFAQLIYMGITSHALNQFAYAVSTQSHKK